MITLANFADENFANKQKWNSLTAKLFGKVNRVLNYSPNSIDAEYLKANAEILKYTKGFGNYFWKPYIILKAYEEIEENDYLFYVDSGSVFLKSVQPLIDHLNKNNKSILLFQIPLIAKQWTKRDAFILMGGDSPEYTDAPQVMGGFILIKKCKESEFFLKEFQKYCLDKRILSDDPNVMGQENYPEFIEHRHDQSILSILSKKHNTVLTTSDISDYGYFPHKYIHNSSYIYNKNLLIAKNNPFKGIVLCNRKINPVIYILKFYLKLFLSKIRILKPKLP
jgi:hypothetical protein